MLGDSAPPKEMSGLVSEVDIRKSAALEKHANQLIADAEAKSEAAPPGAHPAGLTIRRPDMAGLRSWLPSSFWFGILK